MPKVLLDMDGVLVDFVGGVWKHWGFTHEYPKGDYDIIKATGLLMSPEQFWGNLSGDDFWANLEWMPDGKEILAAIESLVPQKDICLLTSPILAPECSSGKHRWITHNAPAYKRQFLIGSAKEFCAGPDRILIDDSQSNCEKFVDAGGKAILVPRPWNPKWETKSAVRIVTEDLAHALQGTEDEQKSTDH